MEKELRAKKAKCKCGVRGCKNTKDVYAISRTRECGNTIIICRECAGSVDKAIEESKNDKKMVTKNQPPPLFFNSTTADFKCQYCGREFVNKVGLASHERKCIKENGGE